MKKVIIILFLIVCLFTISGCKKAVDLYGYERTVSYGLVIIEEKDGLASTIAYDPDTNICYILIRSGSLGGVSPYYVIGEDGSPEIAIYGDNYLPLVGKD